MHMIDFLSHMTSLQPFSFEIRELAKNIQQSVSGFDTLKSADAASTKYATQEIFDKYQRTASCSPRAQHIQCYKSPDDAELNVKFKSNPVPWTSTTNLFDQINQEKEMKRRDRIARRAQEVAMMSTLPPRMQRHYENEKSEAMLKTLSFFRSKSPSRSPAASNLPSFGAPTNIHDDFLAGRQARLQAGLDYLSPNREAKHKSSISQNSTGAIAPDSLSPSGSGADWWNSSKKASSNLSFHHHHDHAAFNLCPRPFSHIEENLMAVSPSRIPGDFSAIRDAPMAQVGTRGIHSREVKSSSGLVQKVRPTSASTGKDGENKIQLNARRPVSASSSSHVNSQTAASNAFRFSDGDWQSLGGAAGTHLIRMTDKLESHMAKRSVSNLPRTSKTPPNFRRLHESNAQKMNQMKSMRNVCTIPQPFKLGTTIRKIRPPPAEAIIQEIAIRRSSVKPPPPYAPPSRPVQPTTKVLAQQELISQRLKAREAAKRAEEEELRLFRETRLSNLVSLKRLDDAHEIELKLRKAVRDANISSLGGQINFSDDKGKLIEERVANLQKQAQRRQKEWDNQKLEIRMKVLQRKTLVEIQREASQKRSAKAAALLKLRDAGVEEGVVDFVTKNLDVEDQWELENALQM